MEKKAKAEAKRLRRARRKQGLDESAPPGIQPKQADGDPEQAGSESEQADVAPNPPDETSG